MDTTYSRVHEVTSFDAIAFLGDLTLSSVLSSSVLKTTRRREYQLQLQEHNITAFKRTTKSVTIYFQHQRMQFHCSLLDEVVELGVDTKNHGILRFIQREVNKQRTSV